MRPEDIHYSFIDITNETPPTVCRLCNGEIIRRVKTVWKESDINKNRCYSEWLLCKSCKTVYTDKQFLLNAIDIAGHVSELDYVPVVKPNSLMDGVLAKMKADKRI
ncbi:MAG: hypothetical protein WC052_05225 [Patescibacteria group bacterium]